MRAPLCVELFAGRFGWGRGFVSEGFRVVGFDIVHEPYHGEVPNGCQLVLQDVLTLHGSQFRDATCIVASPPCQRFSYMAMPWTRAKAQAAEIRADKSGAAMAELTALFDSCFRIQHEASEAAGRHIPLVVENVKGAQPWVGRARAHFGSYYLFGDVESVSGAIVASVPRFGQVLRVKRSQKFNPDGSQHGQGSWFAIADSKNRGAQKRDGRDSHAFENGLESSPSFNGAEHETRHVKVPGMNWSGSDQPGYKAVCFRDEGARQRKNDGGSWFAVAHNTKSGTGQNPVNGLKTVGHVNKRDGFDHTRRLTNQRESDAVKQHLSGPEWARHPYPPNQTAAKRPRP
jgi:hypothetical protein